MINKTNLVSLLSVFCAWQADLDAHEAFYTQFEEGDFAANIEHHASIQGNPSSDAMDKILAKLQDEHKQDPNKQI